MAPIKVLLVDDDSIQPVLIRKFLASATVPQFDLVHCGTLTEGLQQLATGGFDVVLLDLGLPDSTGPETFSKTQAQFPKLPIVVLTALEDENVGVELVHAGAQDYLIKGQANALLVCHSLRYAIERKRLLTELQKALAEVKTLSGLLPVCASCRKVRDDKGYWTHVERYIEQRSDARFSHGLCPGCAEKLYPEAMKELNEEQNDPPTKA